MRSLRLIRLEAPMAEVNLLRDVTAKEIAPSHSCDSHWAGDHCTVCASFIGAASKINRLVAEVNALRAELAEAYASRDHYLDRAAERLAQINRVRELADRGRPGHWYIW